MTPGTFNFKQQYKGNTFGGTEFTITRTTDSVTTPIDLTGCSIQIQFKKTLQSSPSKTFIINSGLTMVDIVNGVFKMDTFEILLDPYKYLYDLKIIFPDSTINTYLTGYFEVKQNLF